MTVVIGTAGHIDHGKTALLRALTGIDADRLPEERARGMTIDVGYAHLRLDDGREIDFVDVPGHDRLVGNMLVGAGEIDAVLLVVAADDGPRAQTVEHLELLDALGIDRGLVAITKTDVVDEARVDAVASEIRRLLARTGLAACAIHPVSSRTGQGVAEIKGALAHLVGQIESVLSADGFPRLAVDRAFSVRGRGVVVTGTLRGGSVARGDTLRIVPGDRDVTVREVQVRGRGTSDTGPGRTALNLRGVGLDELRRGLVLTTDDRVVASDRLLVALAAARPVSGVRRDLPADRARPRLHLLTDQVDVAVGRSGREATDLEDGRGTAVLRLDRPTAVAAGDRFILRSAAARRAEAGGIVLDPRPPVGAARRRVSPERLRALATAGSGEAHIQAIVALHGAVRIGASVRVAKDVDRRLTQSAVDAARHHHRDRPSEPGIPASALRTELRTILRRSSDLTADDVAGAVEDAIERILAAGMLVRDRDRLRDPGYRPAGPSPGLEAAMSTLERLLDVPGPPSLRAAATSAGCSSEGVAALERQGRIVRLGDDLAWATPAYEALTRSALGLARRAPLTPAALRDATGTSRKYVMAVLEDLDRRAILSRTAAGHVPGPRAGLLDARNGGEATTAPTATGSPVRT